MGVPAGDAFATRRDDLAADVDDLTARHGYLLDPTRQEPDTPLMGGGAVEDDLIGEYGSAPNNPVQDPRASRRR